MHRASNKREEKERREKRRLMAQKLCRTESRLSQESWFAIYQIEDVDSAWNPQIMV